MIRTALRLAEKRIAVLPCMPADKRPACEHGVCDATTDATIVTGWWSRNPNFNIGIATGAVSGLFVADIDSKDDLNGEAELRRLEAAHGSLPSTVETITGSGRQLYFLYPGKPVRNSVSAIAPGIDVRGDGGYVVAPPSVHPSGRRYAWSVDSAGAIAAAPGWLIDAVTRNGNSAGGGSGAALPASQWRDIFQNPIAEGSRNHTLARVAGHLLVRRIDPHVALAIMQSMNVTRCLPPLPAEEIETIVASICARELRKREPGHGA